MVVGVFYGLVKLKKQSSLVKSINASNIIYIHNITYRSFTGLVFKLRLYSDYPKQRKCKDSTT